jgi:serine/threonine protein kinase
MREREVFSEPILFGKYYLLERINVGGMGEVFKAKAFGVENFERTVAIKRILPSIARDQEFIQMFISEAKIAVELTHPNIAQVFDLGKVGGSYFIALEYVPGKDLRTIFNYVRELNEKIPIFVACYIVMKICEGLDYAHNKRDSQGRELNLVHRDVSPQNILISYEGEIKIVDFGIAKAATRVGHTQAGVLKGKFGYMSPEQVQGLSLDRRSDNFAVGIILYELLTTERLFVGESDFSVLEKVRNVKIVDPTIYNNKIPKELKDICLKALSKEIEKRYQTAMELHDDLQSFMYSTGSFFSRRDLSQYMKRLFFKEIEEEMKREKTSSSYLQQKIPKPPLELPEPSYEADRQKPLPEDFKDRVSSPIESSKSPPPLMDIDWDHEEIATTIYDQHSDVSSSPFTREEQETRQASFSTPVTIPEEPLETSPEPPTDSFVPPEEVSLSSGLSKSFWIAIASVFVVSGLLLLGIYFLVGKKSLSNITLVTNPTDVKVHLDGKRVDKGKGTPLLLKEIKPGYHTITVLKEGYSPWIKGITLSAGKTYNLVATLKPIAPSNTGFEIISKPENVQVYLNNKKIGTTPLKKKNLQPGTYLISLKGPPEYYPWSKQIKVQAHKVQKIKAKLSKKNVLVNIISFPKKARINLKTNGISRIIGNTPLSIELDASKEHIIILNKEGYIPWRKKLKLEGKDRVSILAELISEGKEREKRKITSSKEGSLSLQTIPWTRIYINGRDTGQTTPLRNYPLLPGRYRITCINSEFNLSKSFSIVITPGKHIKIIKNFLRP